MDAEFSWWNLFDIFSHPTIKQTAHFYNLFFVPGNPPATGTGTLIITLEDENDNAPYVVPSVVRVCEDAKEVNVATIGARDKDIHPNTDPFKIELGKHLGLEKTWRMSKINSESLFRSTH